MARVKFDEKYVFSELEKVGNALTSPVTLYLLGGAAMIKYGLKAATKDIDVLISVTKETDGRKTIGDYFVKLMPLLHVRP